MSGQGLCVRTGLAVGQLHIYCCCAIRCACACVPVCLQKEKGEGKRRELQSHLTRLQQMMTEEKTRRKAQELEQGWKVGANRAAAAVAAAGATAAAAAAAALPPPLAARRQEAAAAHAPAAMLFGAALHLPACMLSLTSKYKQTEHLAGCRNGHPAQYS